MSIGLLNDYQDFALEVLVDGEDYHYESTDSSDISSEVDENALSSVVRTMLQHSGEGGFENTAINLRRGSLDKICVKVDQHFHHLDRIQLALQSDYFEKLFTADYEEKQCKEIEIHMMSSETFSTIIEIIYGKKLKQMVNLDNYLPVLMAMDYLQMEIDLTVFRRLIERTEFVRMNSTIFEFYDFIVDHPSFGYLLPIIYKVLSSCLEYIYEKKEFLTLPMAELVKILTATRVPQSSHEASLIGQICVRWIYHDERNRLMHIEELINTARYRYKVMYKINSEALTRRMAEIVGDEKREEKLTKFFQEFLFCHGAIEFAHQPIVTKPKDEPTIVNKMLHNARWKTYLDKSYFYDISVTVSGKLYQLHILKVTSMSQYFVDLITSPTSNPEEILNLPDKDEPFILPNIESTIFDVIVDFMYFETELPPDVEINKLFKAADFLKIPKLVRKCELYIEKNFHKTNNCLFELLEFTNEKKSYKKVHLLLLNYVISRWSTIRDIPRFRDISFDSLKSILTSRNLFVNSANEILDACTDWLYHDMANRHNFLHDLIVAINRNYMMTYDIESTSWSSLSKQQIKERLLTLLKSSELVPIPTNSVFPFNKKPVFIAFKDKTVCLLNADLHEILLMPSFESYEDSYSHYGNAPRLWAVLIDDNLFMLVKHNDELSFQVFNFSTRKFVSLATDDRIMTTNAYSSIALFSYNKEVHCCIKEGDLLKYSSELNRWVTVITGQKSIVLYTSDGTTLYRIREKIRTDTRSYGYDHQYSVEQFKPEKEKWIVLPNLPLGDGLIRYYSYFPYALGAVDKNLAILFNDVIFIFNPRFNRWNQVINPGHHISIFTQHGRDILYVTREKEVHSVTITNPRRTVIKQLGQEFCSINAIHTSDSIEPRNVTDHGATRMCGHFCFFLGLRYVFMCVLSAG